MTKRRPTGSGLLTCAFVIGSVMASGTLAEEPGGASAASPASTAPEVPAAANRPHGAAYDPHGELDPQTQLRIALRHKAEGRPQEAVRTLSMAIDKHPDQARLYAVRGSLLLEQGRIAPALADLEKAVKLDPQDAEALTNRAQAYRRFRRIEQALADLDRALEIDPELLAARFNRGTMRYESRDFEGALSDLDQCVTLDPHLPGPYFNRAVTHDALGDKQAAIHDLERFLQISTNDAWNQQAKDLLQALENPESVQTVDPPPNPHQ